MIKQIYIKYKIQAIKQDRKVNVNKVNTQNYTAGIQSKTCL